MRKLLALLLALLLLAGCAGPGEDSPAVGPVSDPPPASTEAPAAPIQPAPAPTESETRTPTEPVTEAPPETVDPRTIPGVLPAESTPRTRLRELSGEAALFYPADQLRGDAGPGSESEGDMVSLEALEAWRDSQPHLPRTRSLDQRFDAIPRFLELMDYCLYNGYAGFAVPEEVLALSSLSEDQWIGIKGMYQADWDQMWIDKGRGCTLVWFRFPTGHSGERFVEALTKARQIAAALPPEASDYEKARILYDYLGTHVSYDLRKENYYDEDWGALYDALILERCVCTGFSDALYTLFNLAGLDCYFVSGPVRGKEKTEIELHQWNVAALEGVYYCFDPTWDEQRVYQIENMYFAVSQDTLDSYGRRSYDKVSQSIAPACHQNLDPAALWNDSPRGAVESFLWLRGYCCQIPRFFLQVTGLLDPQAEPIQILRKQFAVYDLDYQDFLTVMEAYMSPLCYQRNFEGKCFKDQNGKLAVFSNNLNEPAYTLTSLEGEGPSYKATLTTRSGGVYTANITLEELDGRWRVKAFRVK